MCVAPEDSGFHSHYKGALYDRHGHRDGGPSNIPAINDSNCANNSVALLEDLLAEECVGEVWATCDWHSGHIIQQEYNLRMKPLPPPNVPGKTEFERFDNAVRRVLTVSKSELLKREAEERNKPETKRPKK